MEDFFGSRVARSSRDMTKGDSARPSWKGSGGWRGKPENDADRKTTEARKKKGERKRELERASGEAAEEEAKAGVIVMVLRGVNFLGCWSRRFRRGRWCRVSMDEEASKTH